MAAVRSLVPQPVTWFELTVVVREPFRANSLADNRALTICPRHLRMGSTDDDLAGCRPDVRICVPSLGSL
jgi:hypothetical protein